MKLRHIKQMLISGICITAMVSITPFTALGEPVDSALDGNGSSEIIMDTYDSNNISSDVSVTHENDIFEETTDSAENEVDEIYDISSIYTDRLDKETSDEDETIQESDEILTAEGKQIINMQNMVMDSSAYEHVPMASNPSADVCMSMEGVRIPSAYDSRLLGCVTSVKNQYMSQTCWLHSSLAASESSLLRHGQAGSDINLSEAYSLYRMFNKSSLENARTKGDYNYIKYNGKIIKDFNILGDACGSPFHLALEMASWKGPIRETDNVYNDKSVPGAYYVPLHSNEILSEYHVKSVFHVPMKKENSDYIKSLIMLYGGAVCDYDSQNDYYGSDLEGNSTFYKPEKSTSNHAVELIGWDDAYSRNNFKIKPRSNGAWLIKNSWGTEGKTGYQWISYENGFADNSSIIAFEFEPTDISSNIYQNDGSCQRMTTRMYSRTRNHCYVELFKADSGMPGSTEEINSVGVALDPNGEDFTVSILTGAEYNKNAIGKQLKWREQKAITTCSKSCAGYYKIPLSETVTVENGEWFGVCVELSPESYIDAACSTHYDYNIKVSGTNIRIPVTRGSYEEVIEGTGFCGYDMETFSVERNKTFCIKAFSNPGTHSSVSEVSISKQDLTLQMGKKESASLRATVRPWNAVNTIIWESSNPSIATVDGNGKVEAVAPGSCQIIAYSFNRNKQAVCNVSVLSKKNTEIISTATSKKGKTGSTNVSEKNKKTTNQQKSGEYKSTVNSDIYVGMLFVKKAKSTKKKTVTVSWKTNWNVDGQEVQLAYNKSFTKGTMARMSDLFANSSTFTNVKKKKVYVRIRGFVRDEDGNMIYGNWSEVKKVKVK